jgi:hypothetical protein
VKRRVVALASAAALGLGAFALGVGPAMADPCPGQSDCSQGTVTATATVPQVIALTMTDSTVPFGTVVPGQSSSAIPVRYTVMDSADAHYNVEVTGAGANMTGTPGGSIPNTNINVDASGNGSTGQNGPLDGGSTVVELDAPANGSASYTDQWKLTVPIGAAAASYSEVFTYAAIGNNS